MWCGKAKVIEMVMVMETLFHCVFTALNGLFFSIDVYIDCSLMNIVLLRHMYSNCR